MQHLPVGQAGIRQSRRRRNRRHFASAITLILRPIPLGSPDICTSTVIPIFVPTDDSAWTTAHTPLPTDSHVRRAPARSASALSDRVVGANGKHCRIPLLGHLHEHAADKQLNIAATGSTKSASLPKVKDSSSHLMLFAMRGSKSHGAMMFLD